jgi:anthranilate phosphoribosyltransferase
MGSSALLIRGTEGEAVADARRTPKMTRIVRGAASAVLEHQAGALTSLPDLPQHCDAQTTANYIQNVLDGNSPIPQPIALQVQQIIRLADNL